MREQAIILVAILWLGAIVETWLVIAYLMLLKLRGRIGRQLLLVALVGAGEKVTLSLLLFGLHVHVLVFITGYALSDVVSLRWLLLLYWARRGAPQRKGVFRMDKIAKAIAAGIAAGAGMYWAALTDDVITGTEWARILGALVITGVLTWLVPNAPATPKVVDGRYMGDTAPAQRAGVTSDESPDRVTQ